MQHGFTDNLVMLAELRIKPERLDAFLRYVGDNLQVSRAARGNLTFDILIDETEPTIVRFYEVWESLEAQQSYMAWRVQRGDLTTLLTYLDGEPTFTALRSLRDPLQVGS